MTGRKYEQEQAREATCAEYQRMLPKLGHAQTITTLAELHGVRRGAIEMRIRRGGLLPPYRVGTRIQRTRRQQAESLETANKRQRVDRDPCPRCGARGDIGCKHTRSPLGTVFG